MQPVWCFQPRPRDDGWYVGAFGGASFLDKVDLSHQIRAREAIACVHVFPSTCPVPREIVVPRRANADFEPGPTAGIMLGRSFGEVFRGELEFSFSRYDASDFTIDNVTFLSPPPLGGDPISHRVSGDLFSYSFLANGWFYIPLDSPIMPYIGGGGGFAVVDANATAEPVIEPVMFGFRPAPSNFDFTDVGFACQIGAEVRIDAGERFTFDLGYRYRSILDVTFVPARGFAVPADLESHNVQIGITFKLGD